MAIHFRQQSFLRLAFSKTSTKPVWEKVQTHTAYMDNSTETAHGYPSRELAVRALRTHIHSYIPGR